MNKLIITIAILFSIASCAGNGANNANNEETSGVSAELLAKMQTKENPYNLEMLNTIEEYITACESDSTGSNKLVDLEEYVPNVLLDIRYATANNFTKTQVYTMAKAYLVEPAAKALKAAADSIAKLGLGFVIYDGYRPYSATVYFREVYEDTTFVASPSTGSNHNRGAAIDLALYNLSNSTYCTMPSEFDTFSNKASWECTDIPEEAIKNREILGGIMEWAGFSKYVDEWWHYNYDYPNKKKYILKNIFFEELEQLKETSSKNE